MNDFKTIYCPRCDRAYTATSVALAEAAASKHMDGQHPDMPNPFKDDIDG